MQKNYITDQKYEKKDYTEKQFDKADYEGCYFLNCNFSGIDLSDINFTDCEFIDCNLSSAKIIQTTFGDVLFKDCKMLGLHFENCNEFIFSARFDNCILNFSSFYMLVLIVVLENIFLPLNIQGQTHLQLVWE